LDSYVGQSRRDIESILSEKKMEWDNEISVD